MTLSKALKFKNKLAGEINDLQDKIRQHNVQVNSNPIKFNVMELYDSLIQKQIAIADLKSKIAIANAGICGGMAHMAELKSRIVFLTSVSIQEGTVDQSAGYGREPIKMKYTPAMDVNFVDKEIKMAQKKIEQLQDDIDEYNHTTFITD